MNIKKIVVLGTGGTIAGTAASPHANIDYIAAQLGVAHLLQAIPVLAQLAFELVSEQVAQVDSKDMSFAVWQQLARRCTHWLAQADVQGIVITHGTDTLEETAYFLQAVLNPAKPVVLTCAMRPATSLAADGPQNVLDAVAVAAHPGAQGVVAVCAGTIHSAVDVQKIHTYRLDAFSSGDAGPLGYVEEGEVRLLRNWPPARFDESQALIEKIVAATEWPRVEIVMSHAGASGAIVEALVAQGEAGSRSTIAGPVRGIVVAATGNGTLHHDLQAALVKAQAAGIRVVRATRCASGRVLPTAGDTLADSRGLSPVKGRIALILELMP